ncbi:MAG: hypothetical protein BWK78_09445 [Thiotrichaceae bacterium IS1]|nr:MAG: hypothetical protein BWK78_09445 [Thiotrichaceae bacterium IS1]
MPTLLKYRTLKVMMLTLLSLMVALIFFAETPFVVINSWGLGIMSGSTIAIFLLTRLSIQLFQEWAVWQRHTNLIYLLWSVGVLYLLLPVPYYYLADLRESYERLHEDSDQEWWEDVGCLMWYDANCGRGKRYLKWKDRKCVVHRR